LNGDYFVAVGLQCWNDFAETRAIGPNAVAENDRWFGLRRHTASSFLARTLAIKGIGRLGTRLAGIPHCEVKTIRSYVTE
jgi:hypothetical protein